MNRRHLLRGANLLAATLLTGCGFRPLYLAEGRAGSVAATELAAVYVPVISERQGQLLRQALQRRLEGAGTGTPKKYELITAAAINSEGIALQRDNSTTRFRLTATATWTLRQLDVARTVITTGNARVVDGVNVINQQYFALDLENEAASVRINEELANQIVTQLAIFLKRRSGAT